MKKILATIIVFALSIPSAFAAYSIPDEYQPSNIATTRTDAGTYSASSVTLISVSPQFSSWYPTASNMQPQWDNRTE